MKNEKKQQQNSLLCFGGERMVAVVKEALSPLSIPRQKKEMKGERPNIPNNSIWSKVKVPKKAWKLDISPIFHFNGKTSIFNSNKPTPKGS